jgi:hypothetical protein
MDALARREAIALRAYEIESKLIWVVVKQGTANYNLKT